MQQRLLLRRVLETAFEKVLRRVLRRCLQCVLQGGRVLRRVLRRGSKKGLSRRHLEGRNTPFREYDRVGVSPANVLGILLLCRVESPPSLASARK